MKEKANECKRQCKNCQSYSHAYGLPAVFEEDTQETEFKRKLIWEFPPWLRGNESDQCP